jgi:hypothetical protein
MVHLFGVGDVVWQEKVCKQRAFTPQNGDAAFLSFVVSTGIQ